MMVIDGKEISDYFCKIIKSEIENLNLAPELGIILATDNPASHIYVDRKIKVSEEVGIKSHLCKLGSLSEIKETIKNWNKDKRINGILLQLPVDLSEPCNVFDLFSLINPLKDVDVFHPENTGLLCQGRPRFKPCTPHGILRMLEYINIPVLGKKITVINSSNVVGKPLCNLLIQEGGTVTVCHDRTPPHVLNAVCQSSDIIVVAVGIPGFLKANMVRSGAVVIDVGITRVGNKIVGDVDFDEVSKVASAISPVPKGVGPCTVAMLMYNVLEAYKLQEREENE